MRGPGHQRFCEPIGWCTALLLGQGAEEFLGTQGDPWDTPSDMFLALNGAVVAVFGVSGLQDRQIGRLAERSWTS